MRLALFALLLLACTKDPLPPSEVTATADKGCTADMICTREYLPTTCRFDEKDFSSSNPCEARRLVRDYACKAGKTYDEAQLSCKSQDALEAQTHCEESRICTREYKPVSCTWAGKLFDGPNRCEAMNKIRIAACVQKLALVEAEVQCTPAKRKKSL